MARAIYEFETAWKKQWNSVNSLDCDETDLKNTEKAQAIIFISNYATYTLDANYDSEKSRRNITKKIKDNLKKY